MRTRPFSKDRLLPQEVATWLEEGREVEGKRREGNGVKGGWRANDPLDARFKPFHGHFRGRHFVPCPTNSNYARFFRPPSPSKTLCIKMKRSSVEIPRESRRLVEEVLKNVGRIFLNCCYLDLGSFCIEIGVEIGAIVLIISFFFSLFFFLIFFEHFESNSCASSREKKFLYKVYKVETGVEITHLKILSRCFEFSNGGK